MDFLQQTLNILLEILFVLIFARVLMSWFVRDFRHPLVVFLHDITEPILGPIRRALPRAGMLDFSPLIAGLIIIFAQDLINRLL